MKPTFNKRISSCFLFLIFSSFINAQSIDLPKEVKFKRGDALEWANPTFNDADWGTNLLGKSWKATDLKENIYAWYRIKIIIPSSIKLISKGKGLKLNLGKIDDVDQTFFNGKMVGQTGGFPPDYQTKWDDARAYIIPENEILWDKENLIAVRVFSPDIGGIGMYIGPYNLEPVGWTDFISFQQNIKATPNNGFTTQIKFTNKITTAFSGTVKYWISNKSNEVLFTEIKPVQIQAKQDGETAVIFSNYQAVKDDFFKIAYEITDDNSPLTVKNERFYLANNSIEIPIGKEVKPIVENKIASVYIPTAFQNQQLNGYLGKRMIQNLEERLLKIDEEGLTGSYLSRPGIHPWAGEHVGKYLETACNVWKNTHDARLKKQMDRIMYKLINSQLEDGYLGTYTPSDYWTSWDVWSHKYNLHGLLAYYTTTGYKPALEASKKMGDLLCKTFGNQVGQRDIILAGEHKGMAATSVLDAMVSLYSYTGEKKYLDFCYYILDAWEHENGPKIISSLLKTGKVTKVGNGKAYEMISNFVGLIKLYRITGDEKLLKPVQMAWQDIADNKLYITGTTSSWEYFKDDDVLPAEEKDHIGEGCVTTTWLQLNQNLFEITGDLKYYNQIEKSIYNHLLGAENPETGCVSYYTPLMSKKPYTCHITCCQSSVPRGIALIPNFTFGTVKNSPTLMLYEPANYSTTFTTSDKKSIHLSLKVDSNFPESGKATIIINTNKSANYAIALRVPSWCTSFVAKIENKEYKGKTNEYLQINRLWRSGDKVNISFDMPINILKGGKSYPDEIAFQRGPQILAFDKTLNTISPLETKQNFTFKNFESKNNISLLPKQWIGKQVYTVNITDKNHDKTEQITLVPFADASQTGGVMKVWLPLIIKK